MILISFVPSLYEYFDIVLELNIKKKIFFNKYKFNKLRLNYNKYNFNRLRLNFNIYNLLPLLSTLTGLFIVLLSILEYFCIIGLKYCEFSNKPPAIFPKNMDCPIISIYFIE